MFDADEAVRQVEDPLDYISPYKPRVYDTAGVQFNRLLCGGKIIRGQYGDHTFGLCAQPEGQKAPVISPRYYRITLAQCEFVVELGVDTLQFAIDQLGVPDAIDHLSSALRDGVFRAAVESFLGQGLGVNPLQIQPIQVNDLAQQYRNLGVEFLGGAPGNPIKLHIGVSVHTEFLPIVVEWLSRQESAGVVPKSALQHVVIPTVLILDEFFAAQSVVKSLGLNDVIITDAVQGEILVRVGHKLQQKGRLMDKNITLEGYLEDFEQAMPQASEPVSSSLSSSQPESVSFNEAKDLFQEIPLQMSFQLCQQEYTLEQLRNLNAGQCLPIPRHSPESILVSVNGKPFAKGEMVQVEDQIGVRIVEFVSS